MDPEEIAKLRSERKRLKAQYEELNSKILETLYRHDPIGICDASNPDAANEYEPEAGTILPRLKEANNANDVRQIVHQEFVRWFDSEIAGTAERYDAIAQAIWELHQGYIVKGVN